MTGIEHLRRLAERYKELGKDHTTIDVVPSDMAMLFSSIANKIASEYAEDCHRMGLSYVTVSRVASQMERHCLGVEGMDDSPVARWARELREALGGDERDHADERDAIAWARDHGGLDYVMHEWQSRVPRDRYELMRQRLLDHIAECETALGRRNQRIEKLGQRVSDLTRENAELRKRAMPEGYEWPRYESGEPLRYEDRYVYDGREREVWHVDFDSYGEPTILNKDGTRSHPDKGERFERSAPKVYDADGVEIRVGDRVWSTQLDEPHEWIVIDPHEDRDDSQTVLVSIGDRTGHARPENLTHRAPVPASDGRPLREGETVWHVKTGREYVVIDPSYGETVVVRLAKYDDAEGEQYAPDQLTHERPVADTWERLEEDADRTASLFDAFDSDASADIRDLVRRAKALAERGK